MKKTFFILILSVVNSISFGQNRVDAEKLVDEGVAYHDKEDFKGAIAKYDEALKLDKDNLLAMTEKALTLFSLQKYEDAIEYCAKAIEKYPGDNSLKSVYVTYGNALDALKKVGQSIEIYNKGIKQFPVYYQLHFNKGITLTGIPKYDEAMVSFQQAALINPKHASSHNAIGWISNINNQRIPSLLAYCRFLVIEPQGNRAKENLIIIKKIMGGNVEETSNKSITINIDSDILNDSNKKGKRKENNFSTTDMILSMSAGLNFDEGNKKKTEVQRFISNFETVCASLKETSKGSFGFFWDYYAPYFIAMKDNNLIEPFAYIIFGSSDKPDIATWLASNKAEVDKFLEWSDSFIWKTN
ncbi:MAG: tetratricopeptide repeat protein [Ferruginibacter sp.]